MNKAKMTFDSSCVFNLMVRAGLSNTDVSLTISDCYRFALSKPGATFKIHVKNKTMKKYLKKFSLKYFLFLRLFSVFAKLGLTLLQMPK